MLDDPRHSLAKLMFVVLLVAMANLVRVAVQQKHPYSVLAILVCMMGFYYSTVIYWVSIVKAVQRNADVTKR